ncbi:hypothetical protein TraAM80_00434 [Trypanosoma rangeli]|uniref:PH domain-containing protein n=1 Tax=Trypanosoma rangeli TaxID=5698 RepID=A0A422P3I5_TRYRA|nr:uncharacterized protein TraAM80_00434 [Trypanosoma rangeli]RNF12286.1 hypothetical protein TraAM80_00434 [Trypanosoma rangeli]|eukprot:RNF12286.1 hypothetical protein TraAM80_00434 [Trypanosoma rangeli]
MSEDLKQQRPSRVYRALWLLKQAEWRFAWDRRFFVLCGLRLAYRLGENEAEKKSGYIISLQRTVGPPESHTFRVWLKEGECWTLRAETDGDHREWTNSIAAALMQGSAEELCNVREGIVLKKGAWTGQWKPRYLELDEYRLAYRLNKESEVRNRFVLVAADASGEEGRETELLVTTSCGERFWLKFSTKEEFNDWRNMIMRGLQRTMSWHWMALGSSRTSEYAPLRVQYHASAAGSGPTVYCYGGTYSLAPRCFLGAPKVFLPNVCRENVSRQLSCIKLSGEHKCTPLEIIPYEESAHAKVRPPPLFGAALCMLKSTCRSSSSSLPNLSTSTPPLECLLLVGGRSETSIFRDVTVEMWWCVLQGSSSMWQRCCYDVNVLPHRTFHTLTTRTSRSAVVAGGLDEMNRVCADCFIIFWSENETEAFVTPPVVKFLGDLPEPRAFHVCLALPDASLFVFGGCSVRGPASCSYFLSLSCTESEWRKVSIDPPLPVLNNVCAAEAVSASGQQRVLIMGETRTSYPTLRLFLLTLQPTSAVSAELLLTIGAAPRRCCGATMHRAEGYLYVFGGCYDGSQRNDQGQTVVFQDPIRMLIGDSAGSRTATTHRE